MALVQADEFEDEWFFENVGRVGDDLAFLRQPADARLVPAEGEALIETAVELALQFADGPVLRGGLNFIEAAFVGVFDAKEEDVVCPTQAERAGWFRFVRQCLQFSSQWLEYWGRYGLRDYKLAFPGILQFPSR